MQQGRRRGVLNPAAGGPDTRPADLPRPPRLARAARVFALAALAAALVLAVLLVVPWSAWRAAPAAPEPALALQLDRLLQRGAAPASAGLAVRPLAAADGDDEAREAAAPVCDALVARLARLPGLRVSSCGSTRVALAAGLDDAALARVLAVGYVLKGEVASRPQGRLHVRLALHDMGTARERWRLERELAPGEVQTLPTVVAERTGQMLGVPPSGPEPPVLDAARYERFVAAQRKSRRPSLEERRAALAEIEALLREVPDHTLAQYLRLALRSRLSMAADPANAGRSEAQLQAAQAALRADIRALGEQLLARDPGDWRAHVLLLNDAFQDRRMREALERADALLAHAARHPGMLRIAARMHVNAGYLERARELALQAARLDALDAEAYEVLAELHGMRGDDAAMNEFASVAEQLGHRQTGLLRSIAAWRARDWDGFERAMTQWVSGTGRDPGWVGDYVQALRDPARREAAARMLDGHDEALRTAMSGYFLEHALLGDAARSLRAVRHHARLTPASWIEQLWWPELAPVRLDSGFVEAMRELGLTEAWQSRGAPDLCAATAGGGWTCR